MTTTRRERAIVVTSLGLGIGAFAGVESLLVPVLPLIQRDLHTDASGVSWTLTACLMATAVATPLLGRVGDLIGKRKVFLMLLPTIALGSIMSALAPTLAVLIAGRVIQGIGGAILPLSFGMIREALPDRVGWAIGILSSIAAGTTVFGIALAGPLSDWLGWRGLLFIPVSAVVASGTMVRRHIHVGSERAEGRVNIVATILLSTWLVAILVALSLGPDLGWFSARVLPLYALTAIALCGWVYVESHSADPLVDVRMLRRPGVWNTNVVAILLGATMFGVWAYFARFLQEPTSTGYGMGLSVSEAGMVMVPMLLAMTGGGMSTTTLTQWINLRWQLAAAGLVIAIATMSMALFHGTIWEFGAAGAVLGFGIGIANTATASLVVLSVPVTQTGVASGMNANLRKIGQAGGTAIMTAIVTGSSGVGEPTDRGYQVGFMAMAIVSLVAAPLAVAGRRQSRRSRATDADRVRETVAEAI